jgi:hypothetical protein
MIASEVDGPVRQRSPSPPVFTTVPVLPVTGVAVGVGEALGAVAVGVGAGEPLTVR